MKTKSKRKTKFIPNTVLPKGGKLLPKPIKKKIGSWVEQVVDAALVRNGIRWFRVKDGMGGRGDREDWIADVECMCCSVHDYNWIKEIDFGIIKYPTFEKAIDSQLKASFQQLQKQFKEQQAALNNMARAIKLTESTLK